MHRMSLTDLSIRVGLYNAEFTRTSEYDALSISPSAGEPLEDTWKWLSIAPIYDPRRTKATTLRTPALCYLYFVLIHTLTGRGDNSGVVSYYDFDFLLSMMDGFHLHFGYEVAIYISHYGTNPCIGSLFVGPYITHLIRCMDVLERIDRIWVISGVASMTLETLQSMGMLQRV